MTKRILKYSLSVIFLSMFIALLPVAADFTAVNQARAAGWWDKVNEGGLKEVGPAYGQTDPSAETYDIRLIAARIIRIILELLGLIFLVIIIVAGFRWMTAGGDEAKIEAAKKQLSNGVIGLVIVLIAFSLAAFIFYQLQYAVTGIMPITWSW